MDMISFGVKEAGTEYIWRPAVYCIMFNSQKDKIANIQTSDGNYFLPGGGIEGNETHEECLKREAIEEMGMEIEIGSFVGRARRYSYSKNDNKYYLSEGYFYLCNTGTIIRKRTEADHSLKWIHPLQAIESLFHEHQSWAVKEALVQSQSFSTNGYVK